MGVPSGRGVSKQQNKYFHIQYFSVSYIQSLPYLLCVLSLKCSIFMWSMLRVDNIFYGASFMNAVSYLIDGYYNLRNARSHLKIGKISPGISHCTTTRKKSCFQTRPAYSRFQGCRKRAPHFPWLQNRPWWPSGLRCFVA